MNESLKHNQKEMIYMLIESINSGDWSAGQRVLLSLHDGTVVVGTMIKPGDLRISIAKRKGADIMTLSRLKSENEPGNEYNNRVANLIYLSDIDLCHSNYSTTIETAMFSIGLVDYFMLIDDGGGDAETGHSLLTEDQEGDYDDE